jgi:ribonuclease Z
LAYPKFEVVIVGCGSAQPGAGRHHSAQAVLYDQDVLLLDCGEGTQDRLKEFGVKWNRINQIFITHLHGDHWFGLPGLISTFHLNHRERPLQIFAPKGLEEPLRFLLATGGEELSFPLEFIDLVGRDKDKIWEGERLEVYSYPLQHRIPCYGYIIQEKPLLKSLIKSVLSTFPKLQPYQLHALKRGEDVILPHDILISNHLVTKPGLPERSFAYWTDTTFDIQYADVLSGVNMLYHEATFLNQLKEKARLTYHSTTVEAAEIALKAGVKQLLIGHYSSRYGTVSYHEAEAKAIFNNSFAVEEGMTFVVPE